MSQTPTRPLSPHLQIYRPTVTMVMSIVHRITGAALYFGSLLLVIYLLALAAGEGPFTVVAGLYGSIFGRLVLFVVTFAAMHHLCGGIRHLIWDTGLGLAAGQRQKIAWATLIGSAALTVFFWLVAAIA